LIGFSDLNESGFCGLHFAVNLLVHQDGGRPSAWIPEILDTDAESLNSQCHAITNKYPEAGTVVQVHKVLNEIEILAHRLK
jgi:hypothetical protein